MNAIEIARKIVAHLPQREIFGKVSLPSLSEHGSLKRSRAAQVEFSGPGFINITISVSFISEQIRNILLKGVVPPHVLNIFGHRENTNEKKGSKVVIDLSSPNIAKEMFVGHLR